MNSTSRKKYILPKWDFISLLIGTTLLVIGHFWLSESLIAAAGASIVIFGMTHLVLTFWNSPNKKRIFVISIWGGLFIASVFGVLSQTFLETMGTSGVIRKSVVAPAVEELLKPIGIWIVLWAWWRKARPKRKEIAWIFFCGVLAGFIFGFVESLDKATDPTNLQNLSSLEILQVRFKGAIWSHVVSTALATIALCYKFGYGTRHKSVIPLMFFSVAVIEHSAWNSGAAGHPFVVFSALAWLAVAVGLLLWIVTDHLLKLFLIRPT